MGFQTTVRREMAFGIPGELLNTGPARAAAWVLESDSPNVIGYAYTVKRDDVAQVGGEGIFAGILIHPKRYALYGAAGDTLAPSFEVPNQQHGELLTMGEIIVDMKAGYRIGDQVVYHTQTGALTGLVPSAGLPSGFAKIPNAFVTRHSGSQGLAVITLTN